MRRRTTADALVLVLVYPSVCKCRGDVRTEFLSNIQEIAYRCAATGAHVRLRAIVLGAQGEQIEQLQALRTSHRSAGTGEFAVELVFELPMIDADV